MMRSCLVLVLASFLLASTGTAAKIYKWTDAQGKVHISDTPPVEEINIDTLRNKDTPVTQVPAGARSTPKGGQRAFANMTDEEMIAKLRQSSEQELAQEISKDCSAGMTVDSCAGYARDMASFMKEALRYSDEHPELEQERAEQARQAETIRARLREQDCVQRRAMKQALQRFLAPERPTTGEIISEEEWMQGQREAPGLIAEIDDFLATQCAP